MAFPKSFWILAALLWASSASAAAAQNGLFGEYYNFGTGGSPQPPPGSPQGGSFTATPNHRRIDPQVNFNFTMNPGPAPGVNANNFVIAWSGFLTPPETGNIQFATISDDGIRMWVDNVQVRNDWVDQGPAANPEAGGTLALTQGVAVPIRVEMYENGGGQAAQIFWSLPSGGGFVIIPSSALTPPAGPAPPTDVAATETLGPSGPIVTVTWSGAAADITFDVQRSAGGGPFTTVQAGNAATTYVDNNVTFGVQYCYQVRAIQYGMLLGAYSAPPACVTPQPPPPRFNDHDEGTFGDNCACGSTVVGAAPWSGALALLAALAGFARRRRGCDRIRA